MARYIILVLMCIFSFFLGILIRYLYAKKTLSSCENEVSCKKIEAEEELKRVKQKCIDEKDELQKKLDREERDFNQKLKDRQSAFDRDRNAKESALKEKERQLRVKQDEIEEEKEAIDERKNRLRERERKIEEDEVLLKEKQDEILKEEGNAKQKASEILSEAEFKVRTELEKIANLSLEQAKTEVLSRAENQAKYEASQISDRILKDAENNAERKARKVVVDALGRLNSTIDDNLSDGDRQFIVSSNNTVINLTLPNDSFKGSIIGRGGQNIRALENILGVNIIIDSTPNLISVSSYDCVRREVATRTIEDLLSTRYISPIKIEEVCRRNYENVDKLSFERGIRAFEELKLSYVDKAIIKHMGVLSFRSSFKQNVLEHSKEVARIAALMAAELSLDSNLALRAGFLHDIGKGLPSDTTSSHALAGASLLRSLGESDAVINAVEAHHNERPCLSLEAQLVQVADAYSAGRPGAREQGEDEYLERSNDIERIAKQHDGVRNAFAVQAGRDLRVFVRPEVVKDNDCKILADLIASEIRAKYNYLGLVRVCIIRESKFENTIVDSIR